jgi:glucosamine 6-phosphate synthetase-like amidotransferase/phosphosugar isomerase protein
VQEAIALEDGDVVHIKRGGWGIFNIDADDKDATVPRVMQKLEGKLESILKGDYEHFMLKEICEQPDSLAATMAGRVKRVGLYFSLSINVSHIRQLALVLQEFFTHRERSHTQAS